MTPEELSAIIARDLETHRQSLHWRGRPLQECLRYPVLRSFANSSTEGEEIELWLVFEEVLEAGQGYRVVYSENEQLFGLAVAGHEQDVFIGFYGGFTDTLNAM